MPAPSGYEKRLRLYLLKLAPEEELDHIEAACLSTSGYADQITLSPTSFRADSPTNEQRAFKAKYFVTQDRRERVAIARAVGEVA